jgi:hypothetical protein
MDETETAVAQGSEVFEHTAEYRQLQRVLKWIGGHEAGERVSIFEFINGTLRHVFMTFEEREDRAPSDYRLILSANGLSIHIEYLDMDGGMRDLALRQASWEDLACTPLVELLRGTLKNGARGTASAWGTMWALAGSDALSLFQISPAALTWLEISPSVDERSCDVLLFTQFEGLYSRKIPADFRAALTSGEILAWKSQATSGDSQRLLRALGGILFGSVRNARPVRRHFGN